MPVSRRFLALLALAPLFVAGCRHQPPASIVPEGVTYLSRAAWGAHDPVLPMKPHEIRRITIHHTGTSQAPARPAAAKLRALQQFSQRDDSLDTGQRKPAWPDVPYHFYLAVDGTVAEGRDWHYAGDSNTPYDPAGHLLVVVEGNFERDTLSTAQRRALEALVPSLARRFHVPAESLASHKDFARTDCPGEHLYAELPRLRALIAAASR